MARKGMPDLGWRERQIVEVVYRLGRAGVSEVRRELPDPPGYSAVRAMLTVLEGKGHLKHTREKNRYIYLPTISPQKARSKALDQLLRTFFAGSHSKAMAALVDETAHKLSENERDELEILIEKARKKGQ